MYKALLLHACGRQISNNGAMVNGHGKPLICAAGGCERIGTRRSMEDATALHCSLDITDVEVSKLLSERTDDDDDDGGTATASVQLHMCKDKSSILSCFGVFDGHGGRESAFFSSRMIPYLLARHDLCKDDPGKALKEVFAKTDELLRTHLDQNFVDSMEYQSGCTAVVIALTGDVDENLKLTCANAGDSRAICVRRDGSFVALSRDHVPELEMERTRIESAGGFIGPPPSRNEAGALRVLGSLAVTRSLGDFAFKLPRVTSWASPEKPITEDLVSADPEIVSHYVTPDDLAVVLACDGVWNVFTSGEAATLVSNELKKLDSSQEKNTPAERCDAVATVLVEKAIERGSRDNCSCVIVRLYHHKSRTCVVS